MQIENITVKCPDCKTKAEIITFSEFDYLSYKAEGCREGWKIEPQGVDCDTCDNAFDASSYWYDSLEECVREWNSEWVKIKK